MSDPAQNSQKAIKRYVFDWFWDLKKVKENRRKIRRHRALQDEFRAHFFMQMKAGVVLFLVHIELFRCA